MRKNSARKWLHFTLDLLPVIAIPVFMIYSHRHSLTERTNVEINYKYETNEVNSFDDLVEGNVYHADNFALGDESSGYRLKLLKYSSISWSDPDYSMDDLALDSYNSDNDNGVFVGWDGDEYFLWLTNNNAYTYYFIYDNTLEFQNVDFIILDGLDDFETIYYQYLFNVTSSDFNVIESVNADTTNENILNVFYKDFTDTIDNYFNFDNVFTFGDIWQWFNTNMFGGNASPIAHAIYEIIVYEFIIDIMFLSYAVFMFIIDFTTDTLERFTGWSSRG